MENSNKEIGRRITQARERARMSKKDLANKTHVSPSTITRYENGEFGRVKIALIEAFAKATGVNPAWIDGNSDQMILSDSDRFWRWAQDYNERNFPDAIAPIETATYPLLGEAACGEPIIAVPEYEVYSTGRKVNADAVIRAKGDSMIGARINNGDIVFIRYQRTVEDGEIAAVMVEDEETHDWEIVLKRFRRYADDLIVLHSENPAYADIVFKGDEINRLRILGKAVAFQSDLV